MNFTKHDRAVISENPSLHIGDLFARKMNEGLFKKFYGKDASLYYFGRGALWQAIQSMRLSASDNVLVPSYHCGVEIEAVAMPGVQLHYYDVGEDFSIDVSDLRNRIDTGTRAILLIHYFGFPQEIEAIKALCLMTKTMLIEDCAQALFSSCNGKPLGTFGDMAIFSQRKTLPLPDGGALLVNNTEWIPKPPENRASELIAIKKALGMLFRSLFKSNPRNALPYPFERIATLINKLIARKAGIRYSAGMEIDIDRCTLAMSGTSRQFMDRTRIEHVIQRRRENYISLLRRLTDAPCIRIVREELPEGACPLFFPLRIEGVRRSDIQDLLQRSAINTFVFGEELHPTLPMHQFPNAVLLSKVILCLPVHQDLNSRDMAVIAETLLRAVRELNSADSH